MWAYIPMFRLFALVVGLRDAFQPLGPTLLQPLVDFPRLLAAFPVDVIRIVGPLLVVLPPGGDALVYGVGVIRDLPLRLGSSGSRFRTSTPWL